MTVKEVRQHLMAKGSGRGDVVIRVRVPGAVNMTAM